ncbi:IucA/IucC family protein [Rhodococcus pyridinivorans]|uniref:IucA/IucC family siderophore biosynthesis protein n=1 Tax=Rhodococcus pyridinivorans TaxID=103816 RepID=A0A7M2XVN9_9NOCA|nr:IucA/IucC family protein [Rhodococcus pyridinivorans]QOW01836.1 IucA/IucC family siderophore biosynthesis protein [Rhodococcus pyridinivorans]
MLNATVADGGEYRVDLDSGITYAFEAIPSSFGWLRVSSTTITRISTGLLGNETAQPAWDAQQFLIDAASTVGTDAATLATYFSEFAATLSVDAARIQRGEKSVTELRNLDHAELESHMTGHSLLVANKGRLGFSASDVRRYAPESAQRVRLQWIAVHRGLAEFRGTSDLSEQDLLKRELGGETIDRFGSALKAKGLEPEAYVWMPVHPWQWDHVVQVVHASDVAQHRIVLLGESLDAYLPGQSVRTMTNVDVPDRYDVKLPLKILNTLVWRGIPPHCTMGAAVVTEWLRTLLGNDPFLNGDCGTKFLGEVASVTVRHPYLSKVEGIPYQHLETLGCIWRESVSSRRDASERVRTMASLLHTDGAGNAFVAELVRSSGLVPQDWLYRFFRTLLEPLVYILYRYGLTFNPHGQNILIGYDDNDVPCRIYIKDFVDDVCVSHTHVSERAPEPDGYEHLLPRKHPSQIRQHVIDAIFVGQFRYLSALCSEQLDVKERTFWGLVREVILEVQGKFPELSDRFAEYDLLTSEIPRYALNRDRLVVTGYIERPFRHALYPNGSFRNPLSL